MDITDVLRLEPHGPDTWVGTGPQYEWGGLYGGQIVAQALRAAAASVAEGFVPHSVRAYFIRAGDHSTPAALRSHSWHPVPVLLAARTCRPDAETTFGERACLRGGLGQIEAKYLMPLALAHAGRLEKYGA